MRAFSLSVIILILLALCSCEYPEQGCFELVGIDANGKPCGSQLFIVEEYVDDTEMTTGFGLLLPALDGRHLVSVPMPASEGFESRGWTVLTNGRQTGLADLDLTITHISERIKLEGWLRVLSRDGADEFHATLREDDAVTNVLFVGEHPRLPEDFADADHLQLRVLSEDEFEERCGLKTDSPRLPLQPRDMQESSPENTKAQASDPGPDRGQDPPPARP